MSKIARATNWKPMRNNYFQLGWFFIKWLLVIFVLTIIYYLITKQTDVILYTTLIKMISIGSMAELLWDWRRDVTSKAKNVSLMSRLFNYGIMIVFGVLLFKLIDSFANGHSQTLADHLTNGSTSSELYHQALYSIIALVPIGFLLFISHYIYKNEETNIADNALLFIRYVHVPCLFASIMVFSAAGILYFVINVHPYIVSIFLSGAMAFLVFIDSVSERIISNSLLG